MAIPIQVPGGSSDCMPPIVSSARSVSETARQREFYKYYHPSSVSSDNSNTPSTEAAEASATSSKDTALTAFAQLGALRLNARRSLISLFDNKNQYVLAEATRTLSLQSDAVHDHGDQLSLGNTVVPREYGICDHVLKLSAEGKSEGRLSTSDWSSLSMVPDLKRDEILKNRPYVMREPSPRFYAGVPLRSSKGINIGVYCVLDDQPRETLDARSVQFLKDMAVTVMDHLEMIRAKQERRRGERMVRGLGSFVEGMSTIRGSWDTPRRESYDGTDPTEGQLNQKQQDKHDGIDAQRHLSLNHSEGTTSPVEGILPHSSISDFRTDSIEPTAAREGRRSKSVRSSAAPSPSNSNRIRPDALAENVSQVQPHNDLSSNSYFTVFSRASNIIRESIEVEGAIFYNASISSFGGLVQAPGFANSTEEYESSTSPRHSSSASDQMESKPTTTRISKQIPVPAKSKPLNKQGGVSEHVEKFCEILGFSTSEVSSIDDSKVDKNYRNFSETSLKQMMRRYPKGEIFHFDESGNISSGESGSDAGYSYQHNHPARIRRAAQKMNSRRQIAAKIHKVFPNARSVAFFPLWDSNKEKWIAGGVAWTNTPNRVLTIAGELSYLTAFGHTVVAEVARLDILNADKAKADVLSSISHELRSPLHGILGSVELLQETVMDAFQQSILLSLETCGRTLLDTLNHLLDFSKVNNLMQTSRRVKSSSVSDRTHSNQLKKSINTGTIHVSPDVELDLLVEDVLDSVCAGFNFQDPRSHPQNSQVANSRFSTSSKDPISSTEMGGRLGDHVQVIPERPHPTVQIILDVDSEADWTFAIDPGAFKRILMNLFANSMKYTDQGFIRVKLRSERSLATNDRGTTVIVLTVEDTGRGISRSFMRERLYMPFSQEDNLEEGIGLGLSITKKIVRSLGGDLSLQSEKGKGTTATITLSLKRNARPSKTRTVREGRSLLGHNKPLTGIRVSFMGFGDNETQASPYSSSTKSSHALALLKSSLQTTCRDWLGMEIVPDEHSEIDVPDVCVVTVAGMAKLSEQYNDVMGKRGVSLESQIGLPLVIVICDNATAAHALSTKTKKSDGSGIFEFISQPCGSSKLAKTFSMCFDRHAALVSQAEGTISPNRSTPTGSVDHRSDDQAFPSRHSEPQDSTTNHPGVHKPTYLIVDDNPINVQILVAHMKKHRHFYKTATNGREAVEAFKQAAGSVVCVLMDISMPVMNGLESSRRIRRFEAERDMKPCLIVALTGLASMSVQEDAFASGFDVFLTKPMKLKELGELLTQRVIEAKDSEESSR